MRIVFIGGTSGFIGTCEEKVSREDALAATVEWERANAPADIDPMQFDYEAEDRAIRGG